MDRDRFDALLRSLLATGNRRGVMRVLAGSALGGLVVADPLLAEAKKGGKGKKKGKGKGKGKSKKGKKGNSGSNPNQGQGQEKITICHKGQTITVAAPAWKGHEKHGDTLGPCETTTTTAPPTTTTTEEPTTTTTPSG
jgi:hypothetical protein